jgi:hypothetical protein
MKKLSLMRILSSGSGYLPLISINHDRELSLKCPVFVLPGDLPAIAWRSRDAVQHWRWATGRFGRLTEYRASRRSSACTRNCPATESPGRPKCKASCSWTRRSARIRRAICRRSCGSWIAFAQRPAARPLGNARPPRCVGSPDWTVALFAGPAAGDIAANFFGTVLSQSRSVPYCRMAPHGRVP